MGYGTGQRNMGALVAALGAATPETTFLFFALAQFPIYLMPQIIKPLAKRFAEREEGSVVSPSPLILRRAQDEGWWGAKGRVMARPDKRISMPHEPSS